MKADTNLMIAGVLHDTVEDTATTIDEIKALFGEDVATLVASHTEDKSLSWEARKQHTIDTLQTGPFRVRMLIMADKLTNLRDTYVDYRLMGDKLWERFSAPKQKQAWYYSRSQDALSDMPNYPEIEAAYWEMVGPFKDLFVSYAPDSSE